MPGLTLSLRTVYFKIQSAHFLLAHHAPLLYHTVFTHTSRIV